MNNQQQIDSSLEQRAMAELEAEHYKEAIELYKQLWESSDDKKWQQQLAYCYLQRALSFGNRGMLREAFIIWENYIEYAELPYQAYDHYICWQIQAQDSNKIKLALQQLTASQLDKQYPELARLLGCLILTGQAELQRYLADDSVFMTHLSLAEIALQAYLDNNQPLLKDTLKQIPYRSAFKDFRVLLNAAQQFPVITEQTVSKIAIDSIYYPAISLLLTCTIEGAKLVQALSQYSYAQVKVATELKGFESLQQGLVESLIEYKDDLSDKVKFDLLIQYQQLWPTKFVESLCKSLLIKYPEGHKKFNKYFTSLSRAETHRLKALAGEYRHNPMEALDYWRQFIDELKKETADTNFKIALILRHMAELQTDQLMSHELIIESLDYDEDLACYLQLLNYFSSLDSIEYKQWLLVGLEKFPKSIELLTQAIKLAAEMREYEQASQYALQILAIDPLNTAAKNSLFFSYLDQSRQFILQAEYQFAEQFIKQAQDLRLGSTYQAQAQLVCGFCYMANQNEQQGRALINTALAKLHEDPVNAYFQATMEALLIELPVAHVLQGIKPVDSFILSGQQLSSLTRQINNYAKDFDSQLLLLKAIEKIDSSLKSSLSQQHYNDTLLLLLAQALDNIHAYNLLQFCSEQGLKLSDTAIWQYYFVVANVSGVADKCSTAQINHLEKAREQADNDKDDKVKLLIDGFIERYYQGHSDTSKGFVDNLLNSNEESDDEYFDPIDELFKHIPEDDLLKINHMTDELMMEITPEKLVEGLTQDEVSNEHILHAMMQDPDLFSTLMVLKAADRLGVEINLSVKDVLGFFDIT